MSAPDLDRVLAAPPHPMAIVTVAAGDRRGGCLVGFHTQCSIDPPRAVVCISPANRTHGLALEAEALGVHYPSAAQWELARLFGEETGHEVDKFRRCEWQTGPAGVPRLTAVDAWWVGRIVGRTDLGDHTAFVLEPVAGEAPEGFAPLDSRAVAGMEAGRLPGPV